jgi:tetratricopeptide (TPR) repeat protein
MSFLRIYITQLLLLVCILFTYSVEAQDVDELLKTSIEYSGKGAYQQALKMIERAIIQDSTRVDLYLQRATVYYYLGNYDYAIRDCYSTVRLKPDVPEVYILRGKVCIITESYGGAILFFGKALKYTNDKNLLFEAFLNRGKAFFALKRYPDAFSDFQAAYAIDENSVDLLLPLADTYLKMNKTQEALSILKKVISSTPDYPPTYELMGRIAIDNKDFPEAIRAYEKYTALKPTESSAFNALANAYRIDMQYEKALTSLNRSLSLDPTDAATFKIKGLIYISLDENEKACDAFFRSMQLGYFEKYGYDLLDLYLTHCEK